MKKVKKHNYKEIFLNAYRKIKIGVVIAIRCVVNGLSPYTVFRRVVADKKRGVNGAYFGYTTYLTSPEEYMPMQEYIDKALFLNDVSLFSAADDKYTLFVRMPEYMGRSALNLQTASDEQIYSFASENVKFISKSNWSLGSDFKVFNGLDKDIVTQVRTTYASLLEEWIIQHPKVNEIYSGCVNTIRIHTVRDSNSVQVFLMPVMCVGCKGAVTNQTKSCYRLFLQNNGKISFSFIQNNKQIWQCAKHYDSGYYFEGGKIPFIQEACDLVLCAAEHIPELRYLAWDVAITPWGPVVVEVNPVSGAVDCYQLMNAMYTKKGSRNKIQEMFDYGMEGVNYNDNCNFKARKFALIDYISEWRVPTLFERYTVLLQSALHRHGIEFSNEDCPDINISLKLEENTLTLSIAGKYLTWTLPENPPEDLYESDRHAMKLAAEIYKELKDNVIA